MQSLGIIGLTTCCIPEWPTADSERPIVFHLAQLRLNVPLSYISLLVMTNSARSQVRPDLMREVHGYSRSSHAQVGLKHAKCLCGIIQEANI
jgi:hypothetical protein